MFVYLQRVLLSTLFLFAAIAMAATSADACSCGPPDIESSVEGSTDVVAVKVIGGQSRGQNTDYRVRVLRAFKGCLSEGAVAYVQTASASAACGVSLEVGGRYLLTATATGNHNGHTVLGIGLCGYNRALHELTDEDEALLDESFEENICGCDDDDDCGPGEWCREAQQGGTECVPFADEGERCGGFAAPWILDRCDEGLVCDVPPGTIDAPGVCRATCERSRECGAEEYCADDGVCREDGACREAIDCYRPGNDFAHIMCLGHAVCTDRGQCGWTCGDPRCVDLSGADFGECSMVIGFGVVDGECRTISGCAPGRATLFDTPGQCQQWCADGPEVEKE